MIAFEKFSASIDDHFSEAISLLTELAVIPAPSGEEDGRAVAVLEYLRSRGGRAFIDGAKNVILEMGDVTLGNALLFCAHTDTVFPAETSLVLYEEDEKLYCPGIGDDTASLAVMLTVISFILDEGLTPKRPIVFVANSCEEGLGNLKGTRAVMERYGGLISEFYSFDSQYTSLCTTAVGSHRYRVDCKTRGGHSFIAFGNENAIVELARLIDSLYRIPLPEAEGTVTTYNVGKIEGGTSVNTIAENASMLYEYRSNCAECLDYMKRAFLDKVKEAEVADRVSFTVTEVGVRPCGEGIDKELHGKMIRRASELCEKHSGLPCFETSGSTDCNIPLSMGIPAVCLGVYLGGGAHTLDEFIYKDSLKVGLLIAGELILDGF